MSETPPPEWFMCEAFSRNVRRLSEDAELLSCARSVRRRSSHGGGLALEQAAELNHRLAATVEPDLMKSFAKKFPSAHTRRLFQGLAASVRDHKLTDGHHQALFNLAASLQREKERSTYVDKEGERWSEPASTDKIAAEKLVAGAKRAAEALETYSIVGLINAFRPIAMLAIREVDGAAPAIDPGSLPTG